MDEGRQVTQGREVTDEQTWTRDGIEQVLTAIHAAMAQGCVASCHDCAEGGIAVAAAEMAFAGRLGMTLDLAGIPCEEGLRDDEKLFAESNTRFIVEVRKGRERQFENALAGIPCGKLGEVVEGTRFVVLGSNRKPVISDAKRRRGYSRPRAAQK